MKEMKYKIVALLMLLTLGLISCGDSVEDKAIIAVDSMLAKQAINGLLAGKTKDLSSAESNVRCTSIELGEKKSYDTCSKWRDSTYHFSDGREGTCRVKENDDGSVEVYSFKEK